MVSAIPGDLQFFFFVRLNRLNSFSRYRASLADSYTDRRKKKETRKSEDRRFARFSDLPVWYFGGALQQI